MNCRKYLLSGLAIFGLAATSAVAALSTDDYVEAAWMTTRFFGAQRSGEGPNWILDGTNHTTSFTKDSYNGKNVSGGWFDCGDHVMYGQSQGYASYVLALAYAEFTEGFYDLYTGDYTDYKASKDYSMKGGKANKERDLLEELRYEADFWVKAAIDGNNFVTVKGDGNADHQKWVTAGMMSTLGSGEGGESRSITGNANDAFTPGLAAAMLAVMARVDPEESNQKKYLAAAKTAYGYSKSHKGVTNSSGFYESSWWDGRWQDGPFLAALELYRTTKDDTYKADAEKWYDELEFLKGSSTRFGYNNVVPLSVVMGLGVFDFLPSGGTIRDPQDFLDRLYKDEAKDGIFKIETDGSNHFHVRSPSGGAFLYALYAKFMKDDSYDNLIEKNIAYLLGDNSNKKSYVVGFSKNGANAPKSPHHRGYYGNEDPGREVDSGLQPPEKNKLLGGMIAGNFNSGSHSGTVSNWQENEVCVDMNAPLVGALGYILSKKAPKTDEELGVKSIAKKDTVKKDTIPKDTVKKDTANKDTTGFIPRIALTKNFNLTSSGSMVSVSQVMNMPFKVQVFDLTGKLLQEVKGEGHNLQFKIDAKGVFRVRVISARASEMFTVKAY